MKGGEPLFVFVRGLRTLRLNIGRSWAALSPRGERVAEGSAGMGGGGGGIFRREVIVIRQNEKVFQDQATMIKKAHRAQYRGLYLNLARLILYTIGW